MERLDFVLPDFTRLSWVSDLAREAWEPRLRRITTACLEIEWLSVASGIRDCGLTRVGPEQFVVRSGEWAKHGLSALPVGIQGVSNYSYSTTAVEAKLGEPFVFSIVLGTPRAASSFKDAWDACDHEELGRLLGYPPCCLQFFREVWVEQGLFDTTWPMAAGVVAPAEEVRTVEVTGPPEANILWRWMGARAVPHLPCSFDCKHSVELGRKFVAVGREAGYDSEMDWLLEFLSWPVEWSALHGIAEIKTPILRASARTDATARKHVVRRKADAYPAEGARGLNFPYRRPRERPVAESAGFQRGLENPIKPLSPYPEWYASDNGFSSRLAMDTAHTPLVELATATLSINAGNVLDLGCANGALLKKIHEANPEIVPFGIDVEASRIEHARVLLPQFADNFAVGDIFESELIWPEGRRYALAILMPGRLLEAEPERAAELTHKVMEHCDHVLVYAYGDWLTRYGDLRGLAREAGLVLLSLDADSTASLATSNGRRQGPLC